MVCSLKEEAKLRICSVYWQAENLKALKKFNFKYNVKSTFCNTYILQIFKVKLFNASYNIV